ncbi:hypothetical protein FTUN_4320 [Frigoriglobus tundricola]|uniref:Uncharacterized protein n=1 Tax=Frigoriglobus tundricola TaxID=2774151 RepID=A0A6M5YU29_9BACT|nr:hypothetical protein FTUN_4320 [Frigoriglobus tundricola]
MFSGGGIFSRAIQPPAHIRSRRLTPLRPGYTSQQNAVPTHIRRGLSLSIHN